MDLVVFVVDEKGGCAIKGVSMLWPHDIVYIYQSHYWFNFLFPRRHVLTHPFVFKISDCLLGSRSYYEYRYIDDFGGIIADAERR